MVRVFEELVFRTLLLIKFTILMTNCKRVKRGRVLVALLCVVIIVGFLCLTNIKNPKDDFNIARATDRTEARERNKYREQGLLPHKVIYISKNIPKLSS